MSAANISPIASASKRSIAARKSAAVLMRARNLSLAIVHYVRRTRQKVVLGDAVADSQFNGESYIAINRPKSVLCIPLQKQSELIGILYLENNLAVDAFTAGHTELLEMLSTQIDISLENAGLYWHFVDIIWIYLFPLLYLIDRKK